ncbi:hypothetical protein P40081_01135 [Paenibacillus sp. FSL P4-0081]|uniref:hyaluronate lyase N-terminal domain-containing protein n=1 Tax=Paenibacillus sp. FSL P4-0081 TaxID=1536769 RepID=UPI0004F5E759|nr:hypothetical protein [Paenibacillus sp. FSL P4-0081]AIQ26966.1 hypothetical protein P40081_01135 [Paenibacillus sp. FSL P4-0081]
MPVIKIKRGLASNVPALTLEAGELALATDTGKLYAGDGTNKIPINPDLTAADIPSLTLAKITDAGTAASKAVGTAVGNVVVVESGGKINPVLLPALAITDTFPVASQAAMLALTAEVGDIAVRTDLSKTYILRVSGASTLANWQEILSPTAAVSSVAGKTGAVTLAASDVGLGNVTNESKATMFTSPNFTGNPTVTTQATADSSTRAASTAFVKAQGYLSASDTIDGGTF